MSRRDLTDATAGRRPRAPGLLNAGIVAVVVSLVAAVALTARQQPPPTVAEFAPQAVEQIRESLPEQADAPAASSGGQPADEAGDIPEDASEDDEVVPEETDEEAPIERARVRRCVGDPPRQTEDPQSPPCVPYFDGDNGGATWQGVTADTIRVAVPRQEFFGAPDESIEALVAHFNQRYEFYGRRIVVEFYNPTGGTFAHPNPPDMIADAVHVDEEIGAFASIGYPDRKGSEYHYYDELAQRGVVSSAARLETSITQDGYRARAPYRWNVTPSIDIVLGAFGDFACRSLSGHPPQGGGLTGGAEDPLGLAEEVEDRTFGLVYFRNTDGTVPPVEILIGALSGCGAELAVVAEDDAGQPNAGNVVLQLNQAGVTSVLFLGDPAALREDYMNVATSQNYFPEWVVTSYVDLDVENVYHAYNAPPEQAQNVLGLSMRNKILPRQHMPWYWAYREVSGQDAAGGVYYPMSARYAQLLQLASGIQLAGPDLTPENFARGLQSAVFPNPGAGGPPYFQAAIDYRGRHTAMDSGALVYFDPNANGTVDPAVPGAICYLDGGVRYRIGGFPAPPQPFFQPPCR